MQNQPQPPTDDPNLPSYQCPEYLKQVAWWDTMLDTYNGDLNNIVEPGKYLPRERNEHEDDYRSRLTRSPFKNYVADTVKAFAGSLGGVSFDADLPLVLQELEENIDLRGTGLYVFLDQLDIASLRDGYCFAMIDFNARELETKEQEVEEPTQAFAKLINCRQVINWELDCGRLERATICEEHHVKKGYGYESKTVYRCLESDTWRLVELVEDKSKTGADGKPTWMEVPIIDDETGQPLQGQFLGANGQPLQYCPLVPYCLTSINFETVEPPEFLALAQQNIKLYQNQSDYWAIVHICCCPVPWFRVDSTAKIYDTLGNISLGVHDIINLGSGAANQCGYLEASSAPIEAARQSVIDIEQSIKDQSLSNIAGDTTKTATEIRARINDVQKRLSRFAAQKQSAIKNMMDILADFSGVPRENLPEVSVSIDISSLLTDEKSVALLYQAGLLSIDAAVQRLEAMGFNNDAQSEILALEKADQAATDALAAKLAPADPYPAPILQQNGQPMPA
jgi:Domain of unknown function (DUF4055)